MTPILAYWHNLDPALKAWIKVVTGAASNVVGDAIISDGFPSTHASWAKLGTAILLTEIALFTHSPLGPKQGILPGDVKS